MLTRLPTEAPIPTEEWQSPWSWESCAPDLDCIGTTSSSEGNSCWPSDLVTWKRRGTSTFRDTISFFFNSGRLYHSDSCPIPTTMVSDSLQRVTHPWINDADWGDKRT